MTRRTPRLAGSLGVLAMTLPIAVVVSGSGSTEQVAGRVKHLKVKVGTVPLLYPGVTTTFPVRVKNPYPTRVRIVKVRVKAAPSAQCGTQHLVLGTYKPKVRLKAKRSRLLWLPIGLRASAPMACEQVSWKLKVRVRVSR